MERNTGQVTPDWEIDIGAGEFSLLIILFFVPNFPLSLPAMSREKRSSVHVFYLHTSPLGVVGCLYGVGT